MTSKPETLYANAVNKLIPGHVHREKNNNPYRGGTPDFFYEWRKQRWVEYKFVEIPKRADTFIKINLSALQVEWLQRNYDNGHEPLVVVGSRAGGIALRHPGVWTGGVLAGAFLDAAVSKGEIASILLKHVS